MCTYIHVLTPTHTHTHKRANISTFAHANSRTHTHANTYTRTRIHAHVRHTHICTHTQARACTHTHMHTHTHTHIQAHIRTHKHKHKHCNYYSNYNNKRGFNGYAKVAVYIWHALSVTHCWYHTIIVSMYLETYNHIIIIIIKYLFTIAWRHMNRRWVLQTTCLKVIDLALVLNSCDHIIRLK